MNCVVQKQKRFNEVRVELTFSTDAIKDAPESWRSLCWGKNKKKEKQLKNDNKLPKFNLVRVELTFNADERDNAPGIPMKFEG